MNSIVAIGGPELARVAGAYRALVPSAVWTLGLATARDPKDPGRRSLESLLEPFMQDYFAQDARREIAAVCEPAVRRTSSGTDDPDSIFEAGPIVEAAERALAAAMSLVVMLDNAHAIQSVELVLTDGASAAADTAAAWARARGLPSVNVPDQTRLGRPLSAHSGTLVVIGPWARRAVQAGGGPAAADTILATAAPVPPGAKIGVQRGVARQAFLRACGWGASDCVVVFEPTAPWRYSALEDVEPALTSLRAIFGAFAMARAQVAALRLAIIGPAIGDTAAQAARAASESGLTPGDFAYAASEPDVWIAGADICVSSQSSRSVDAALAGIPAVNLWRPASWLCGPAFAAEDGVIDVPAALLGATLVALAGNAELRAQIASIGAGRIGADPPVGAQAAAGVARELHRLRRPAPAPAGRTKPDILVVAPDYRHDSAGVRALHRLCHFINQCGGNASIYPASNMHPSWNTPRRDFEVSDETIVIHAESTEKIFKRGRMVRWVLNVPGLLGGPKKYDADEMVFFWRGYRDVAQTATPETLTDERELTLFTIDPELYFNDRSRLRLYDCLYVGKGAAVYARLKRPEARDAFVIRREPSPWPSTRAETANLLRGCRRLYTYDLHTAIAEEAVICGAEVYFVHPDGTLAQNMHRPRTYVADYFDAAPVERFLASLDERWR
jgi:hypothetical protein